MREHKDKPERPRLTPEWVKRLCLEFENVARNCQKAKFAVLEARVQKLEELAVKTSRLCSTCWHMSSADNGSSLCLLPGHIIEIVESPEYEVCPYWQANPYTG